MISTLNQKWQDYIISRKRNLIIAISQDEKRSAFFNFLIESRNLTNFSDKDKVSMLMQVIDLASTLSYDEIDDEMCWYLSPPMNFLEPSRNSPLSNPSIYTGNYV